MSKYPQYGYWTPLDVVNIVTQCLSYLDTIKEKKNQDYVVANRKQYQIVLQLISQGQRIITFYDITLKVVREFLRSDGDFYVENPVAKVPVQAAWSNGGKGISIKEFLDVLIKNEVTQSGADKFFKDMQNIIKPDEK